MRYVAAIAVLTVAGACSGDPGTGASETNNGQSWELVDGGSGGSDAGTTENNSSPNSGSQNSGTNSTSTNNPANNSMSTNSTSTNNGSSTNSSTNGGGLAEGDECTLNSQCSAGLTCCAGFDGNATCSADCFTGGLCGGDDGECGADTECCDLSGISAPDTCLQRCGGGNNNGGSGDPCDTNPDCQNGEVCCPGFDGNGSCTTPDDCLSGGACEADGDCQNNQLCCDLSFTKVCLDQCSF